MLSMTVHNIGEVYAWSDAINGEVIDKSLSLKSPNRKYSSYHSDFTDDITGEELGMDLYYIIYWLVQKTEKDTFWIGTNEEGTKVALWFEDPREAV